MPPELNPTQHALLDGLKARRPDLAPCLPPLLELYAAVAKSHEAGGTLFLCGNGGSHADAIHIAGELCKSFERKRPISPACAARLRGLPHGEALAQHLEAGMRAIPLGCSGALKTAIENDIPLPGIAYAQELNALVRPGDVLLAISTSGKAQNCLMAMSVAKAHDAIAAALTGPHGGPMAEHADIAIRAPGDSVKTIQEAHIPLWHTLCLLLEARLYTEMR